MDSWINSSSVFQFSNTNFKIMQLKKDDQNVVWQIPIKFNATIGTTKSYRLIYKSIKSLVDGEMQSSKKKT